MSSIKNIIFDLGGVLLNIDYGKTKAAFEALGFHHFDQMYTQYMSDPIFAELEQGFLAEDSFYDRIMPATKQPVTKTQIKEAWNAMLLDFREESLSLLEKLSQHYKLYLLSNTNAIHLEAFNKLFTAQTGKPSLDVYFTKAWYSHLVGLRKPNLDIYEFVLEDAGLVAGETLFIDDSYNNIDGAKAVGLQTHLLLPGESIEHLDYFARVI